MDHSRRHNPPGPPRAPRLRRPRRRRAWARLLALGLAAQPLAALPTAAPAQVGPAAASPARPPSGAEGPARTVLGDPVVDAEAQFQARRAWSWREGDTDYLRLEGDVTVAIGVYGFRARQALVRIVTPPAAGQPVRHLAVVLDHVGPLHGRGPTRIDAERLLVTAATTGPLNLTADLFTPELPAEDAFLREARARMDEHLAAAVQPPLPLPPTALQPEPARSPRPPVEPPAELAEGPRVVLPPAPLPAEALAEMQIRPARPRPGEVLPARPAGPAPPPSPLARAILPADGVVSFNADRVVYRGEGEAGILLLLGDVRVMYHSPSEGRGMTLRAENVVIFVDRSKLGDLPAATFDAAAVRGIYLEDNVVATDGQYTVRAPRVFYDLATNRAIVLDAVLYTFDVKRELPIYLRAEKLMQLSQASWMASGARLSTSEFAQPHFAVAADRITLREVRNDQGERRLRYTARDMSLRVLDLPVFGWPQIGGEAGGPPVVRVAAGYSDEDGPILRTTWDLFALSGRPAPEGVVLSGSADYQGDHGLGLGLDAAYDRPRMRGDLRAYGLLHDQGEDSLADRNTLRFDGQARGFVLWQHRHQLRNDWELSLETGYVSQETLLEEFVRGLAENHKPFETSLYLKNENENGYSAFDFLLQYDVNEFLAQTAALQSPGYTVDRLPELGYYEVGRPLWDNRLTYFAAYRASQLRLRFGEDRPEQRGFTDRLSRRLFGQDADVSFEDAAEAAGFSDDPVARFDTRHEIQAPMAFGTMGITPYVTGQFTAFDDDFEALAGNDDQVRFWGAAGVRLHTQFQRVYDQAAVRWLDVHRLRHIVEPHMDVQWAGSTVEPGDWPVFDVDVEGLSEGLTTRFGLRNTLQTQRGGPGRWRSVDWLVLDTEVILRSEDANLDSPIGRYFPYRPEFSRGGDHFHTRLAWMLSDSLALAADVLYDLDAGFVRQWHLGFAMDHTPRLSSFATFTRIEPLDTRLFTYGLLYQLTAKYTLGFEQVYDFTRRESRTIDLTLTRALPRWRLVGLARFDEIDDERIFGVVLLPGGVEEEGYRGVGTTFLTP